MNLEPYPESDGRKVWLTLDETDQLLHAVPDDARIPVALGVRCGLRACEASRLTPNDVVDTAKGWTVRVREEIAKYDKYRETVIPPGLAERIQAVDRVRDMNSDEPIWSLSQRSLERRVASTRAELVERTDDDGWRHYEFHDGRRTWATLLVGRHDVDPLLVCQWGGWDDLETFLDHYHGTYSPHVQREARRNVDWL